jgi:membrane protease YdiL (CAAX protease family)
VALQPRRQACRYRQWEGNVHGRIRALRPRTEFAIVVSVAFGYLILGSVLALLFPSPHAPISEGGLRFLLVYEPVILLLLGWFLSMRGWSLEQLGFRPSARETLVGFGLAAVTYLAYVAVWLVAVSISSGLPQAAENNDLVAPGLSLITIIAASILNPIFEEVFVCGYVISALTDSRGLSFGINVSVGLRLLYHLYQGAAGVLGIIPVGLVFAYWYARTGRLWPVIVAHALFDFVVLLVSSCR